MNNFSQEVLREIFKCDKDGYLLTTESYDIEYKMTLNIDADFLKTISGLANNRGGYIICGVEPDNRTPVGLADAKVSFYKSKIDSEDVRGRIMYSCQPNILYKHHLYEIEGARFVLFYIPESNNKPHIFSNNMGSIRPGDIYYRYNDSIKKIQYAELSAIIEEKRVKEQEKWMRFLGEISQIGLENTLIIDKKNGRLINSDSKILTISQELLNSFKLIKEGEFVEKNGALTLKLVGNVLVGESHVTISADADTMNPQILPGLFPFTQKQVFQKIVELSIETKDGIKIQKGSFSTANLQGYNKVFNVHGNIELSFSMPYGRSRPFLYSQKYIDQVVSFIQNNDMEKVKQLVKSR